MHMRRTAIAVAGLVFLIVAGRLTASAQNWQPTVTLEPSESEVADSELYAARRQVQARLREPSSGVFGPTWVGRNGTACGYVSARNGFGEMTGMQPFVLPKGGRPYLALMVEIEGKLVVDGPDQAGFVAVWNRDCRDTR